MEDQLMRKVLAGVAATVMLAALALPGTAGAAQKQEPGVYKQTAGEEFSSQRRYYRRRYYVRRYWPRYYGYYGAAWPYYYGYAAYPYYTRPYVGFGFGPFWGWW
jgi:hypothetical protein